MPRFPYMNFPFPFYKTPPKNYSGFYTTPKPVINTDFVNHTSNANSPTKININKIETTNLNIEHKKPKNKSNNNAGDYLFDLFGLKIYSDDILLVSLIYFLYSEGVKDDGLFLVLILLLLS